MIHSCSWAALVWSKACIIRAPHAASKRWTRCLARAKGPRMPEFGPRGAAACEERVATCRAPLDSLARCRSLCVAHSGLWLRYHRDSFDPTKNAGVVESQGIRTKRLSILFGCVTASSKAATQNSPRSRARTRLEDVKQQAVSPKTARGNFQSAPPTNKKRSASSVTTSAPTRSSLPTPRSPQWATSAPSSVLSTHWTRSLPGASKPKTD